MEKSSRCTRAEHSEHTEQSSALEPWSRGSDLHRHVGFHGWRGHPLRSRRQDLRVQGVAESRDVTGHSELGSGSLAVFRGLSTEASLRIRLKQEKRETKQSGDALVLAPRGDGHPRRERLRPQLDAWRVLTAKHQRPSLRASHSHEFRFLYSGADAVCAGRGSGRGPRPKHCPGPAPAASACAASFSLLLSPGPVGWARRIA